MSKFEFAQGSTPGVLHVLDGRPNQDACAYRITKNFAIAFVADGCSDGTHTEVGAHQAVHVAIQGALSAIDNFGGSMMANYHNPIWAIVRHTVISNIQNNLSDMGLIRNTPERVEMVKNFYLFTLVGVLIDLRPGGHTSFAAIGDGFVMVNGARIETPTFEGNTPPYVAYELIPSKIPRDLLFWNHVHQLPTDELQSFLIGSDGMNDLAAEPNVLPLPYFWEDDRVFANRDMVRRKLALCNGGVGLRTKATGFLKDDTTMVVGRRVS